MEVSYESSFSAMSPQKGMSVSRDIAQSKHKGPLNFFFIPSLLKPQCPSYAQSHAKRHCGKGKPMLAAGISLG